MIFAIYNTKAQMSVPCLRDRPYFFTHVFNVPVPRLYECFFILFFSLEMCDPIRPEYHKKYKNPSNIWRKKIIRKMLGRGTLNTCAIFQGLTPQKRRGHLDPVGIWGHTEVCLNQPKKTSNEKGRLRLTGN